MAASLLAQSAAPNTSSASATSKSNAESNSPALVVGLRLLGKINLAPQPFIKREGGINRVTPEERAALFERTTNYRHGYDDGKSAGISAGRLPGLAIAGALAAAPAI